MSQEVLQTGKESKKALWKLYCCFSLSPPYLSLSLSLVIFPNDYTVLYIIAVWRLPWILLSSTHPTNTHLYSTAFSNNYYKWMIILLAFCDTPQQQQEGGGQLFFKWKNFKFENYKMKSGKNRSLTLVVLNILRKQCIIPILWVQTITTSSAIFPEVWPPPRWASGSWALHSRQP